MKRLTIMGIIACVALLVGSAAVVGGPAGPPGGLDVNVVSPDPLPVTGDVTGTVTGEVKVNNSSAEPVPVVVENVKVPSIQPAQITALPILDAGYTRTMSPITIFTVSSDKLLVIEHFSMFDWEEGLVPDDTGVVMVIYTRLSTNGVDNQHSMGIAKVLLNPDEGTGQYGERSIYSLAQPVRIYAGPGTDVKINIFRNHPINTDQVFAVTMSGHYEDIDN